VVESLGEPLLLRPRPLSGVPPSIEAPGAPVAPEALEPALTADHRGEHQQQSRVTEERPTPVNSHVVGSGATQKRGHSQLI